MPDVRNQQEVTAPLMDAPKSNEFCTRFLLRILAILFYCSGDNKSLTVPRRAGNLKNEIEEFIPGVRRYDKNIRGRDLQEDEENEYRQLFTAWNTFLELKQGIWSNCAIISSDIKEDINKFIPWHEELEGTQWTEDKKKWIKRWFPRWNMFLKARAGKTQVTCLNLFLTVVGFIFYIVDQVSDITTSMYYASNKQWWQAMVTLTIVYGAVIIHTVVKWPDGQIHCTCSADWLRYVGSLLVNWPDLKQYGELCLLEWKLHQSPVHNARLVPEWSRRRLNVTLLKFTEGVWEACPQSILQLYLLVPDLYGDLTWSNYFRIVATSVSLCTAGAALVNWEKLTNIFNNNDLDLSELVVMHVWAVSVTVSRLLSVALLLSVQPYWALAGLALHLVLRGIDWCRTVGVPRSLDNFIDMYQVTLQFFISPFNVAASITYRRLFHAIHFLGNAAATVVWALGTPLVCAHSALYAAIICFNAVMFALGLLGWQLHENYAEYSVIISIQSSSWFVEIDRKGAEAMLRFGAVDGSFLVRPSSNPDHVASLSVVLGGQVFHINVRRRNDGWLTLGQLSEHEHYFASIHHLVQFYQQETLVINAYDQQHLIQLVETLTVVTG